MTSEQRPVPVAETGEAPSTESAASVPESTTSTLPEPAAAGPAEPAAAGPAEPEATTAGRLDHLEGRALAAWDGVVSRLAGSPLGRWWKRTEQPGLVDWSLLAAITALLFVTFLYSDVRVTFEHSFNFLDALFSGRPQDFYQIALDNSTFGHPAVYDVPIYLVFGLWNLPTYLFARFGELDYLNSLPAQLWLKAMMLVFALIAAKLLMDIVRTLGMSAVRSRWVAFYFLSSMALIVPVVIVVQYDIVPVVFMLAGLHAHLRGRTRQFLLWFLVANTFKLFSVFLFIPLILLREKRLGRAGLQLLVGMLGLVACRLLYHGDQAYALSTGGFGSANLPRLLSAGFPWVAGESVPIFVVVLIGTAILAYAKRTTSERELQAFAIYLSLVVFLAFCALVPLNPYWIALVAPFLVLVVFLNPRHLTLNTLLELSIGSSLVLIYSMVGFSIYNNGIFDQLVLGRLVPPASPQRFGSVQALLDELGLVAMVPFLVGFLIACSVAMLVLNYPRAGLVAAMPNTEPVGRGITWLRLAAPATFTALLLGFYLLPAPPVAFSSETATPVPGKADIVNQGSLVQQDLTFEETLLVEEVQIGFDASAVTWINTTVIEVRIEDATGATVLGTSAPTNTLAAGMTSFPSPGLVLEAGETYTLYINSAERVTEPVFAEPVFVQLNPTLDTFPTFENGLKVPMDIVLTLVGTTAQP